MEDERVSASPYAAAVAASLGALEHVSSGHGGEACSDCEALDPETGDEGFSWTPCEACGSSLGGQRYAAHGLNDDHLLHFSVCVDCVLYLANGEEPDL